MSQQVFISYSRRDGNAHAEQLHHALEAEGFRVWRDTRNINPNQDFTAEIEMGIKNSDVVAVCVTPDLERPDSFVRREIQYALLLDKPIFPCLMVKDVLPPIPIINKEWLEFHKDWPRAFNRLLQLIGDPNLQQPPGKYHAQPDEPFHDYLQALYEQIVRYLDQAVIKLIDLEAEASPEAVPEKQAEYILLEFFECSIFADVPTDDLPKHTTFKDAFEHHKGRLLLLGEPGAGKTITLMSHARDAVAARLTDPSLPLPVLKILATWKSNPPAPLVEWCAGKMDALKPVIASGRALLLLDGLDELGGERPVDPRKPDGEKYDPRQRLIDAVDDLHANNQVLVTCRVADYAAIGQQIPLDGAITLQSLTDDQLREYLADHPEIYAAIQADEELRELARTPLLLSLITFAWDKLDQALKDQRDLQAGDVRDAIFEAYCRQRYAHEAKKRHADLPFTYPEMMEVLGELAMWNAQNRRPGKSFRDDDSDPEENVLIPDDFEVVIKDRQRVAHFQQMTTHLNILATINEADYRFVHLLLRDFLAYTFALPRMRDQSFWREGLLTASHPFSALGTIKDSRAVDPLIDCLGDAKAGVRQAAAEALEKIGEPAVEPLIECLRDANGHVRQNAAKALGGIGDERAVGPLIECLRDAKAGVRREAAGALGRIGDARAVQPLIECLRDADAWLRSAAAGVLGRIGDARAVEPLIECLRDADAWLRSAAAGVLGRIGDARAVQPLIACLRDADADVRQTAVRALGKIGDGRAVEPLIQCLHDSDADVRRAAAEALVKTSEPAVEPLIECLRDADADVRQTAVRALGKIGDGRAVEPLIECLRDADADVRQAAAGVLKQIGWQPQTEEQKIQYLIASQSWGEVAEKGHAAVEPLIECLRDANVWVRGYAAEALGGIDDKRAVEPLIECLRDVDAAVRWDAAGALAQIGDERAVVPLIECLNDVDAAVRWTAAEALGGIGDGQAVVPLIECLRDTDERVDVRIYATRALAQIGEPAVEPLIACLSDANVWVRGYAAKALGGIDDERAVEPLIECLRDVDEQMRRSAAWALGQIGDERAVEPLIECLGDAKAGVRRNAAEALAKIGEPAVEPLIECLRDADVHVRRYAAVALGEIGDAHAVVPLIECLRDADVHVHVRGLAVEALEKIGEPAVAPLIECLRDAKVGVRRNVAEALEKIGEPAVEPLIACLRDASEWVRREAAEALGRISDGRAVVPLIECLHDENAGVRSAAAETLAKIGDGRAVEPLIECLHDENAGVRSAAAETLAKIGDGRAVVPLIECLGDASVRVRRKVARALGDIGWQSQTEEQQIQYLIASQSWGEVAEKGHAAVQPLIECLRDADAAVRRRAADALAKIGDAQAAVPLIICMRAADVHVRKATASALEKIGEPAVEPLIECLRDADTDVRETAASALAKIGEPAVEPLIACLGDADADVRRDVANALGRIGDVRALEPLIECLRDTDPSVRWKVAEALEKIGEPAVEPLIECLRDADANVRRAAAAALAKFGDVRALERLIECLSDKDEWVRIIAAAALGQIGDARAVEPLIALLDDKAKYNPFSDDRVCDVAYSALRRIGTPEALQACTDWIAAGNAPKQAMIHRPTQVWWKRWSQAALALIKRLVR